MVNYGFRAGQDELGRRRERDLLEIEDELGDVMDVAGRDDIEEADDFSTWKDSVTEAEDLLGDLRDEMGYDDEYGDDEY